jgi:hypothetical protein
VPVAVAAVETGDQHPTTNKWNMHSAISFDRLLGLNSYKALYENAPLWVASSMLSNYFSHGDSTPAKIGFDIVD